MRLLGPLAPEAAIPPNGPDGKPQPGPPPIGWLLAVGMAGAALGSIISNLDTRLTAFSLADLRGGAGFGVDEASWVSQAYNIAEVVVVPITPWLAGIVSPRRAIAAAAALLTLAGAFVPLSVSHYPLLVALRFLQGLGGGALIPLLLLTVLRFTPPHQRVFGLAAYGLITAVTPLLAESPGRIAGRADRVAVGVLHRPGNRPDRGAARSDRPAPGDGEARAVRQDRLWWHGPTRRIRGNADRGVGFKASDWTGLIHR